MIIQYFFPNVGESRKKQADFRHPPPKIKKPFRRMPEGKASQAKRGKGRKSQRGFQRRLAGMAGFTALPV
jgi:hypothetical protein